MGEQHLRHRFTGWNRGMNSNREPYLLADGEYSYAKNMVLNSDVPESRLGSAALDLTNYAGAKMEGLQECYSYNEETGAQDKYLISVGNGKAQAWKYSGGAYVYHATLTDQDASDALFTAGKYTRITNFKNRALFTNGEDDPREFQPNFHSTYTYPLGLTPPKREELISDFPTTAADDDGDVLANYAWSASGNGVSFQNDFAKHWQTRTLVSNTENLRLRCDTSNETNSQTILFDSTANFTAFSDGTTSDKYDWLAFSLYLVGWEYLERLTIYVDFDDGDFDTEYATLHLPPGQLDYMNWIGYKGGRYEVKIPKLWIEGAMAQGHTQTWPTGWETVKAIKFEILSKNLTSWPVGELVDVYIDYFRLLESPPVATGLKKQINGFEQVDDWKNESDNSSCTNWYTDPTEGLSGKSLEINTVGALEGGGMYLTNSNSWDFSHWSNDVDIRPSDVVALDVYATWSGTNSYALIGLRLSPDLNGTDRIGFSREAGASVATTAYYMGGVLTNAGWSTVRFPIGWILDLQDRIDRLGAAAAFGQYRATNHPLYGNTDRSLGSYTAREILSYVKRIDISVLFSGGTAHTCAFDNLRLEQIPSVKTIATFESHSVSKEWDLTHVKKTVKKWADETSQTYPMIGIAYDLFHRVGLELKDTWVTEVNIGESWSVLGCTYGWDRNVKVRASDQSLRLDIKEGKVGYATKTFGTSRDLSEYGSDLDAYRRWDSKYVGLPSDDYDNIVVSINVSNLRNLKDIYLVFNIGSSGDFFLFRITPSMLSRELAGKNIKRPKKGQANFDPELDIELEGKPDTVPDALEGFMERHGIEWYPNSTESFTYVGDMMWHRMVISKNDFARYGSTAADGWWNVSSFQLIVSASDAGDLQVWFDNCYMQSAGPLQGEYMYKAVFRSRDLQSAPTLASVPFVAEGSDALLQSIPISDDDRVVYKDIYRLGGGGTKFQYVDTIGNDNETYVDKKADWELGEQLDEDYEQPPICKYGWGHGNRYILANNKRFPSRVYYSRAFIPGAFPEDGYLDIEPTQYGEITGGVSRAGEQIVFKTNALYRVVEGTHPTNKNKTIFWFHPIDETIGCDSPNSIFQKNNIVYWIWRDRAYRLVGNRVDELFGEKLADIFSAADNSNAVGGYHDGRALFATDLNSAGYNDSIVSFNTRKQAWEGIQDGDSWHSNALVSAHDGVLYSGSPHAINSKYPVIKLFTGLTDVKDTDESTIPIESLIRTRYLTGLEVRIEGGALWVWVTKAGAADTMTIKPILDYVIGSADTKTLVNQTAPQVFRVSAGLEGAYLGYEFACNNDTGLWKVLMATLEFKAETDQ